jgi:hypothetical protein
MGSAHVGLGWRAWHTWARAGSLQVVRAGLVLYDNVDRAGFVFMKRTGLCTVNTVLESGGLDGAGAPGEGPDQLMLRSHL